VVDDISKLWTTRVGSRMIGASKYCHTNFTIYITGNFRSNWRLFDTFNGRKSCYFNTSVMVIDLVRWKQVGYMSQIERWMEIYKSN
jgi:hypothetical protein